MKTRTLFLNTIALVFMGITLVQEQASAQYDIETNLFPIQYQGKKGCINKSGELVITPRFDKIYCYSSEEKIGFQLDGKYGFVNKNDDIVIGPLFDGISMNQGFREGLASVQKGEKHGFVNAAGEFVIEPQFESAEDFVEGLAAVKINGKWGFIDKIGTFVIEPKFDHVDNFLDGLSRVKIYGKNGVIDRSGKFTIPPIFDGIVGRLKGYHPDYPTPAFINGAGWGLINRRGEFVVKPQFNEMAGYFDYNPGEFTGMDTPLPVRSGRQWGYIDVRTGAWVVKPQFDQAYQFSEGLAPVTVGGKTGFIDKNGQFIIKPKFDTFSSFRRGKNLVGIGKKYALIDRNGRSIQIEFDWINEAGNFTEADLFTVSYVDERRTLRRAGYANLSGNYITDKNVTKLPKKAEVAKSPEVKPIGNLIRTGAGENPSAISGRCAKDIGVGGSFEVTGGKTSGTLKSGDLSLPETDKSKRCVFLKEVYFVEPAQNTTVGETWIIIHGWNNDVENERISKLADAIRAAVPKNDRVLMLDWSEAAISMNLYKKQSDFLNAASKKNLVAGTWIRPVAEETVKKLREIGVPDDYAKEHLHLVGHSLGSLVSEQIGSFYKQKNQHGIKSLIALDPPSELAGNYQIDGRNLSLRAGKFQNASPFSRAFVGAISFAGNQEFTKTAHESIKFDFGDSIDLGTEHGLVIDAFTKIISRPDFKKPGSNENLFTLGDLQNDFIRKDEGYTGIIYVTKEIDFKSFEYTGKDSTRSILGTTGDDSIDIRINTDKTAPYLKDIFLYDGSFGRDAYKVPACNQSNISIIDPDDNTIIDLDTSSIPFENGKLLASVEIDRSKIVFYGSKLGFYGSTLFNSPKFRCEIQFNGQGVVRAKGIGEWQIKSK
jgi:pimeloyl-ACP methyl ester carboxylesterase